MAAQNKLKLDYDLDFKLIGLFSHAQDFKLCWYINKKMVWQLERANNLPSEKESESIGLFSTDTLIETVQGHTMFAYVDEENHIENYLIANLSESGFLLNDFKQFNYFLLMRGDSANETEIENVLQSLNNINAISSALKIDVDSIKDAHILMF
jgi:DNA-directed RNA polymerase specialized sigma54-like protein